MQFVKLDDNPKFIDVINKIHSEPWPRFLNESAIIKKYWRKLYKIFPQYQFLLKDNSEYIGLANTFPIFWNREIVNLPTGFDESIEIILQEPETANTLCALAIVIKRKFYR